MEEENDSRDGMEYKDGRESDDDGSSIADGVDIQDHVQLEPAKKKQRQNKCRLCSGVGHNARSCSVNKRDRTGRVQDRTGRDQDRTGRDQDRTGRDQDRTGREQDRTGRVQDRTGRDQDRTGRSRHVAFHPVQQEWDFDNPCEYCGFMFLQSHSTAAERKKCCSNGYFLYGNDVSGFTPLEPLPEDVKKMIFEDVQHFSSNSMVYNRMLSIADTYLDNGRGGKVETFHGNAAYTINGSIRYFLNKDALQSRGGLSYFTFEGRERLSEHATAVNSLQSSASSVRHGARVQERYLQVLFEGLQKDNPFCAELTRIGERIVRVDEEGQPVVALPTNLTATINNDSSFFEVAAFTADNLTENRTFRYRLKGANLTLASRDPRVEALVFPLLFWNGEDGYDACKGAGSRKEIQFNEYMRARMLIPEEGWRSICEVSRGSVPGWTGSNPVYGGEPLNPLNRFQVLSRVSQAYAVECVARAQDWRLQWHRGVGKATIFGYKNSTREDSDADERNDEASASGDLGEGEQRELGAEDEDRETFSNSCPTFLSESYVGGPRHLKSLAKNALVIVSEMGAPSVFITLTCNADDPAILSRLLPGQTAFDRPETVVQVFRAQLRAFLHNLRNGKYLGGKTTYLMHVIEYQHRGLPHAHIVAQLENVPQDQDGRVAWIARHIQARYPGVGTDEQYADLITKHQLHTCSSAANGCLNAQGICKRGYRDHTVNAANTFNDRGYPEYHRPTQQDLVVVPHNREMLLDWKGHLNVEFCGSTYAVLYLYKYLFKGNQKVSLRLNNTDDVDKGDEIKLLQRGRMLSSMQAWWFIMGYQNYPASQPSAKLIKVKLPHQVHDLQHDNKVCDLAIYFARPQDEEALKSLTYTEFFKKFDYRTTAPKYATTANTPTYEIIASGKTYVVFETKAQHIVRMGMVPIAAGEIFWLRVLMSKVPAYSFAELRTVDGVCYRSFQEAVHRRNLVDDQVTATEMFQEGLIDCDAHQLRVLFVNMTLQGFPTVHIYRTEDVRRRMYHEQFQNPDDPNHHLAENMLLAELAKLFKNHTTKTLADFGLPMPLKQQTEVEIEKILYPPAHQQVLAQTLSATHPLTAEMQDLLTMIDHALDQPEDHEPFIIVLQGVAGTGKSTFVQFVMAHVRARGYIAKGCASTGLAASVYEDFTTAHKLFAIPVIDDEESFDQEQDLQCQLSLPKHAERRDLLNEMRFCAWDEISSQHMRDIRAVLAAMNHFRGKILLFIGDGLQITPVVPFGTKTAVCASSVYCSELRRTARYVQFTQVLRLQNVAEDPEQAAYSRLLHDVAYNSIPPSEAVDVDVNLSPPFSVVDMADLSDGILRIAIPRLRHFFDTEEALNFCFPVGFDTQTMHQACILAVTNTQVDTWNAAVQSLNSQPLWVLHSKDTLDECDDPYGYLKAMVTDEVMHRYEDPSKAPPHGLELKLNDICILMRAVSKPDKLATNTRVRVVGISNHLVRVCTLHPTEPKYASLPRFVFELKLPFGKSFTITRRQFPLRLAYSLTINRAQGQTLDRVVVDLTRHCFMHGHLNVALSRIRHANSIALYIHEQDYLKDDDMILTTNVVYQQIIDALASE